MKINNKLSEKALLILIILTGAFLRFYKLDWGNGIFPHPDENLLVGPITSLIFPNQMNPHFFNYGSFTIYMVFFTQQFLSFISSVLHLTVLTINPIMIGRFYSAFFSTLTIPVVFLLSRQFLSFRWSLLAAFLLAMTPGLIQQAHFITPETNQTFFLTLSLLFLIYFAKSARLNPLLGAAVSFALALSVKISSAIFGPVFLVAIGLVLFRYPLRLLTFSLATGLVTFFVFVLTSPFILLDFSSFQTTVNYEGLLAAGQIDVFYTRQFINTRPVIFQLEKILPFALGPTVLVLGILGFFLVNLEILLKKPQKELVILGLAFCSLFFYNGFLFVKWTRYMAPTLPLFVILAVYFLNRVYRRVPYLVMALAIPLLIINILWSLAFFSIYLRPDVRISATNWLLNNLPPGTSIVVEGANTVDVPLGGNYPRISLDMYSLENDPASRIKAAQALSQSDVFLVQSRRVFLNHQRLPEQFPNTARFYDNLFSGQAGFRQIGKFSSSPSLINLQFDDELAEETWSVFDHPVIRVFTKERQLSDEEYVQLF